ncbi:DUF1622 domain-containing protein [Flaviflagellibacter deserti]|uniref:DUF1622 domain-containing protein n=1 Tax=Flaviflagellibacter deserti TaxID=2267266 RepID=A0ABV9Z228_9HYPH
MSELLVSLTEASTLAIDLIALCVIVYGTVEAACMVILHVVTARDDGLERRAIWLRYARWLVAGLTFQLAADILETSVAPDWQTVGRLGAIAVIRTFLNYFLDRDLAEIRERNREGLTPRKGEVADVDAA